MTSRDPHVTRLDRHFDRESEFTKWLAGARPSDVFGNRGQYLERFERTTGVDLWDLEAERDYDGDFGGYSADIVGRGYHDDEFVDVVIEAQFDRGKNSSQNHLGKLLLYGNLADADVLVWLTDAGLDTRFYETVGWLRPRMTGVEIQVVQTDVTEYDDGTVDLEFSRPAPEGPANRYDEPPLQRRQRRFWAELVDTDDTGIVDRAVLPTPGAIHRQGRTIDIRGVKPELVVDSNKGCAKVRIRFDQSAPQSLYEAVFDDRQDIEQRIAAEAAWAWADPDATSGRKVEIRFEGLDLGDRDTWAEYHRGLRQTLHRMQMSLAERGQ